MYGSDDDGTIFLVLHFPYLRLFVFPFADYDILADTVIRHSQHVFGLFGVSDDVIAIGDYIR